MLNWSYGVQIALNLFCGGNIIIVQIREITVLLSHVNSTHQSTVRYLKPFSFLS